MIDNVVSENEQQLLTLIEEIEEMISPVCMKIEKLSLRNHKKVLEAFHKARVTEYHLKGTTGYGYGDPGRQAVEDVYSSVFKAEAALVRGQIASGTHAISLCLFGILRPGDELLTITGKPYDTLEEVLGVRGDAPGSLKDWGITCRRCDLTQEGDFDKTAIKASINKNTKMVMLQRSRGYDWRQAFTIEKIEDICSFLKSIREDLIIFVDNCYGEFVEEREPLEVGADIIAGSLIKNPGGGLAPTGGYVAGKKHLVEMAASRLTAPGIGGNVGATLDFNKYFLQGFFLAPHVVCEALKGAVFAAALFERLGYDVSPKFNDIRSDIIQGIRFGNAEEMVAFCRGLQKGSPLDGHIVPEPWEMPGYDDKVIMAGGTFVSGSTIELSADGPIREPYAIYMQGGLSKDYTKLGLISAALECRFKKLPNV